MQEVMEMNVSPDELKRFQETADINEIAMMLGRYVTLMDQFDAKSIYEELFAKDDPEVSVEYDKLIDRQLERAAITSISGFGKICTEAAKVLEV